MKYLVKLGNKEFSFAHLKKQRALMQAHKTSSHFRHRSMTNVKEDLKCSSNSCIEMTKKETIVLPLEYVKIKDNTFLYTSFKGKIILLDTYLQKICNLVFLYFCVCLQYSVKARAGLSCSWLTHPKHIPSMQHKL